jgi:hypothetical protein
MIDTKSVPPSPDVVEKLEQVKKYIFEVPARLNMAFWGATKNPDQDAPVAVVTENGEILKTYSAQVMVSALNEQNPPCGSFGCLAGEICIMANLIKPDFETEGGKTAAYYAFGSSAMVLAADWLGVNNREASKLFFLPAMNINEHWPYDFDVALDQCKPGTVEYAQVVANRIDHYILTGE